MSLAAEDEGSEPTTQRPRARSEEGAAPAATLPWFQRISFRLTLGASALALVAFFALPGVHHLSKRLFGLPGIEHRMVRVGDLPAVTGAYSEIAGADLRPHLDLDFVALHLLTGARHEGASRWIPDEDRVRALDDALLVRGQHFAWLDADRQVVARSEGLELDLWFEDERLATLNSRRPFLEGGAGVELGVLEGPIWNEGEHAGWLLLFPAAPREPAGREAVTYLPEEEFDATRIWRARIVNYGTLAFIALLATGLSWALSRVVTRRVTRLSQMAAHPVAGDGDLPGPFDDRGDDEIARLARSMNAMRARVLELVEDVRERDRDRRRWIALVSHDLRTPLTALLACLERAEEDLRAGRSDELRDRLDVARLDAERLGDLAEDLLDIARLDVEERGVREPVPPGELVRQTVRALTDLAERAHVELGVELGPGLPELSADGRRLMRALENLLRNALHHARRRVVATADLAGDAVRFAVVDDGPGLPESAGRIAWEELGGRLSRPDSAGLGLVVVRKVAALHGGRSGAENLPEGGARVWFEIPRTPDGEGEEAGRVSE